MDKGRRRRNIGTGLAVLITDKRGGVKKMYIGKRHAGKDFFYDCIEIVLIL